MSTTELASERHFALIECNEAAGAPVFWMMAAVLPLLGFATLWIAGVPFRLNVPARDFNPLVALPIVASLAGLFFLLAAIFMTLRLRRYGTSTLALAKRPRIGGRLLGRISSTADVAPEREWTLVVKCIETISAVAGRHQVSQTDVTRWEYKTTIPVAGTSLRDGLPVDIAIPENCLAIVDPIERARTKRGPLRWVLSLEGRRSGLNYLASFALPLPKEHAPSA